MTLNLPSGSTPTKIALIAPDLSGGGVTRVYLLAKALQHLNLDVSVVGFRFGPTIYPAPPDNLPVYAVQGCSYPALLYALPQLLKAINADLVYAVKPKPTSFGVALLKKLLHRHPVLLDIDDWELSWMGGDEQKYRPTPRQLARDLLKPTGALRQPDHRVYLEWMEQLIGYADAVTVDTQFLQQRFGGTYLPNGKDVALFDPARFDPDHCRAKYGLSNYRVLMFPGTARPHKGLEDILAALDLLDEPDLRLVIVGGRKPDNYDDYLMETWGRWIIRLPTFASDQMPEIVAAAHVVVVPQRQTPTAKAQFPLKLTDGMAMGKPVLSTRVGDIPDIVGDGGYLVEPSSPQQLADQIQWIFSHWEEAQLKGQMARTRCVQRYSTDAMSTILAGLIDPRLTTQAKTV